MKLLSEHQGFCRGGSADYWSRLLRDYGYGIVLSVAIALEQGRTEFWFRIINNFKQRIRHETTTTSK